MQAWALDTKLLGIYADCPLRFNKNWGQGSWRYIETIVQESSWHLEKIQNHKAQHLWMLDPSKLEASIRQLILTVSVYLWSQLSRENRAWSVFCMATLKCSIRQNAEEPIPKSCLQYWHNSQDKQLYLHKFLLHSWPRLVKPLQKRIACDWVDSKVKDQRSHSPWASAFFCIPDTVKEPEIRWQAQGAAMR